MEEALSYFFSLFGSHQTIQPILSQWRQIKATAVNEKAEKPITEVYDLAASFLEQEMYRGGYQETHLDLHQQLFREMESHIANQKKDDRYHFILVIPVADRPQHLENCLNSLLTLCQRFTYGGITNHHYEKITVLIADDSKKEENKKCIRALLQRFTQHGLKTDYYGQSEQLQQIDQLDQSKRNKLDRIIGHHSPTAFYHKGASITRNISYLKLNQLVTDNERTLIWFIDSDQEFQVNTNSHPNGVYAINYFHRLNQIFSSTHTSLLTGKVVGDPPVSPTVMAGNLLQDVIAYLNAIANIDPSHNCQFHSQEIPHDQDAAYHDMAELFGFQQKIESFHYQCRLKASHNQKDCFSDFSEKLNRFFDGEHPTRQSYYDHQSPLASIEPARTVYTGNYVLKAKSLAYFIPFATLKLRMAGPVLGRILKAELGDRFISANLPMLHKRTVDETGQSEFRPGIDRVNTLIDMSGEFERQFFGDVMLFTIEALIENGYPRQSIAEQTIQQTLEQVESSMQKEYADKHAQIVVKLESLKQVIDRQRWWQQYATCAHVRANFLRFIRNMEYNFGDDSPGYQIIHSTKHREKRRYQIHEALLTFSQDRPNWLAALSINP
ncbi:MAG: hypothetical protein KZQ72_15380 [Candidatus Thiodiazotropha sp. (ex Cardiolucina cf. quadrata)]|nr:hypothetical protein [Candidatus Thiodiazotropha sp. (ex Cardiolucina cf. quadrata)]